MKQYTIVILMVFVSFFLRAQNFTVAHGVGLADNPTNATIDKNGDTYTLAYAGRDQAKLIRTRREQIVDEVIFTGKGVSGGALLSSDDSGNLILGMLSTGDLTLDRFGKVKGSGKALKVVKFNFDDGIIWSKSYPYGAMCWPTSIASGSEGIALAISVFDSITVDGVVYGVQAKVNGRSTVAILHLDHDGDVKKVIEPKTGVNSAMLSKSVFFGPDESILFTVNFLGTMKLDGDSVTATREDCALTKIDKKGSLEWMHAVDVQDFNDVENHEIAVDRSGNVYWAGVFKSNLNFEGGVVRWGGVYEDIFLVRINSDGKFIWGRTIGSKNSQDRLWKLYLDADEYPVMIGQFVDEFAYDSKIVKAIDTYGWPDRSCFVLRHRPFGSSDLLEVYAAPSGIYIWSFATRDSLFSMVGSGGDELYSTKDTFAISEDSAVWVLTGRLKRGLPTFTNQTMTQDKGLILYPNPSNDRFSLAGTEGPAVVVVYDLCGAIIKEYSILQEFYEIPFVQAGTYLVEVKDQSTTTYLKLIKQ